MDKITKTTAEMMRFSRHTLGGRSDETLEGERWRERERSGAVCLVLDLFLGKPLMVL